jgi:glutathione S-transferase
MAIKLYDLAGAEEDRRFSPYCWRVKMALLHKGLEFETIPWRFTETEVIKAHGSSTVPVLVDGGKAIYDSWTIAEYLDEAYPSRPALFEGTGARALAYFLNQWIVPALHLSVSKAVMAGLLSIVHEKDKAYFRASREKRFGMPLEEFMADSKGGVMALRGALKPAREVLVRYPFLSGRGPGYADYILFGTFQWARCVSPVRLLEPDDPVYAWRERILQLFAGYAGSAKGYPVWA